MKSCFVVNYWADTDEKVQMVVDCLKQLKKTGKDIIYTSLYPIDKRISNETNFSIFSNTNDLISTFDLLDSDVPLVRTVGFYTKTFNFFSRPLNWDGVSYTVCEQLTTNFKMLKSLGYTHCHFTVGDCFIVDNELDNFAVVEKACSLLNKKAYFDDISEKFKDAFSGVYFYADIDFFLENFTTPKTKQEHIEKYVLEDEPICFEQILKYHFKNKEKYLLLGNNDSFELNTVSLFKESNVDIIKSFNSRTEYHIVPLELVHGVKDTSYVFVISREPQITNFKIYVDEEVEESNLGIEEFSYLKINKKEFYLKVLKNDIIDFEGMITERRLNRIHSYAFFDAHKRNI